MATRAADNAFGEPVRLSFFKGGEVDGNRPSVDTVAQVHLPGEGDIAIAKGNKVLSAAVVDGVGLLIVNRARSAVTLSQGDKVRLTSRAGEPWYEISAVDARDLHQVVAVISAGK